MRPRSLLRTLPAIFVGALSVTSVTALSGCMGTRYHDPVFNDNHRWNDREEAAYRRWEAERRLEHIEFQRRRDEEQREYWRWRHYHPDRQ